MQVLQSMVDTTEWLGIRTTRVQGNACHIVEKAKTYDEEGIDHAIEDLLR